MRQLYTPKSKSVEKPTDFFPFNSPQSAYYHTPLKSLIYMLDFYLEK